MSKSNRNNTQLKDSKMSDQDQVQTTALTPPVVTGDTETVKPVVTESQVVEQPAAAPQTPPVAEVVETPVAKVAIEKPAAPDLNSEFNLPLSASQHSQMLIQELKSYVEAVAVGKPHNQDVGGQHQTLLYHALLQIVNSKAEEFKDVFGLTLKIIAANMGEKGVFNFMNMHRFTTHVTLSSAQGTHLRQLLNLLVTVADPATRKAGLRQVDVEKALRVNSIKEDARQRVLAYFNA